MFFFLALLARTVQFKFTQCILHTEMTMKITYTDQTGQDSVERAGPDRVDQGSTTQGRARPGRVEQTQSRVWKELDQYAGHS